jgi:hypothetical protein
MTGIKFASYQRIFYLLFLLPTVFTPAAERQDPDFLIGPRNKKKTPKKKVDHKNSSSTSPSYKSKLLMMMVTENLN